MNQFVQSFIRIRTVQVSYDEAFWYHHDDYDNIYDRFAILNVWQTYGYSLHFILCRPYDIIAWLPYYGIRWNIYGKLKNVLIFHFPENIFSKSDWSSFTGEFYFQSFLFMIHVQRCMSNRHVISYTLTIKYVF